jgi:formylglycine-generating enzyme required for sulfatase activity
MYLAAKLAFVLSGMAVNPQGTYSPLYETKVAERVSVRGFALDRAPVTRGEFLEFVRRNPEWRKSAVKRTAADNGYLADWAGDLSAGSTSDLRTPVTGVSRNAALAYCAAKGKRLPTSNEWEYAAAASETKRDAARDRNFISRLIGFYRNRASGRSHVVGKSTPNVYGVRDMHELVWELTADPHAGPSGHAHDMSCAGAAMGALDPTNYAAFMRYAVRSGVNDRTTMTTLGFRCAGTTGA